MNVTLKPTQQHELDIEKPTTRDLSVYTTVLELLCVHGSYLCVVSERLGVHVLRFLWRFFAAGTGMFGG